MEWKHASHGLAALLLVAAIGLGNDALAAGTCDGRPCIRIGSYNIKLLGAGGTADRFRDRDEIVERIAAFDVVVLQEINKNSGEWKELEARLEEEGLEVVAEGEFGGADPDRQQFIMILAKPDVVQVVSGSAAELQIPTENPELWRGCEYSSLRPPVTALMRAGEFDFRLVGVHLKSNLPVEIEDEEEEVAEVCDNDIRQWQAEEVVKHLKVLQADDEEDDVIIIGDFNAPFSAEEFYPLRVEDFVNLVPEDCFPDDKRQTGCTHLVSSRANYDPSAIDLILVPRSIDESAGGGEIGALNGSVRDYRRTQSDHLPVWAEFYTDRDGD